MLKRFYKVFGKVLAKRNIRIVGSLFFYNKPGKLKDDVILDYIRSATLELVAKEIEKKKLGGSLAELGVYKGEFASKLNQLFPLRKLYLFDTFEGFDERDKKIETAEGLSSANQNFANTSVDLVLSKMVNPSSCIVRKGYFPQTAQGLEDEFAFVSLDADLYEPILAGLNFFYPRLVKGGFIFIHDYNNNKYRGAEKAVKEFCAAQGVTVIPIPDICGTAIISK